MFITVTICTLNRAESLRRALTSLRMMEVPHGIEWEIVVVNNGCNDHTDDVICAFTGHLPVQRELEPQRGLSRARNHAIDVAMGEYIIWTDDDVIVGPDWLNAYAKAFRRWPDAAVFAGPVEPRYADPVPRWILDSEALLWNSVWAGCDFGQEVCALSPDRVPWGPNFAVRTAVQREFRFDTHLGHAPGRRRGRGEETDVIRRILRTGAKGFWLPEAKLQHCSDASQQTRRYVANYFRTYGETIAFISGNKRERMWLGVPRWALRQLVQAWLGYNLHRLFSPPPVWVKYMKDYYIARGVMSHWWVYRRDHDKARHIVS